MLISYGNVIFDDVTGDVYDVDDDQDEDVDWDEVDRQIDEAIMRRLGLDD